MRIKELRQCLNRYEGSRLRKFFFGPNFEAIKIRMFLNKFKFESDNYQLTDLDLLNLCNLISFDSQLSLIRSIKTLIGGNHFFEIFTVLNKSGVITEQNFTSIFNLPFNGRNLLYQLYCSPTATGENINLATLTALLNLIEHHDIQFKLILEICLLLNKNHLLNTTTIDFIQKWIKELPSLVKLLRKLNGSNQLTLKNLDLIAETNDIYHLYEILNLANLQKLKLDSDVLPNLYNNPSLSQAFFVLNRLNDFNIQFVNQENFMSVMQFLEKTKENEHSNFLNAIEFLSAKKLEIDSNQIQRLLASQFDMKELLTILIFVENSASLNLSMLNDLVSLKTSNPKHDLFPLICSLANASKDIKIPDFSAFMDLSPRNFSRLNILLDGLKTNNLLNDESFAQALRRITLKFPTPAETPLVKTSRKISKEPRSEFSSTQFHFFIEHKPFKNYLKGGCGKVKQAYSTSSEIIPRYAVKTLFESNQSLQKTAEREVKYNTLLGRQAYYFKHNSKPRLVIPWQAGKVIFNFRTAELKKYAYQDRLRWIISGLKDINKLHARYRVHGDVKPDNFVVDEKTHTMRLIDMGSTHKIGSTKLFAFTRLYRDPQLRNRLRYSFCDDIYAMGFVIATLFPELFIVSYDDNKLSSDIMITKKSTALDNALKSLVKGMTCQEREKRCSAEDALQFCKILLDNNTPLNDDRLQQILDKTIQRRHITTEDIFRHRVPTLV